MYPSLEPSILADETYELVQCDHCSLAYQVAIPDPPMMKQLYGSWIDPQQAKASDQDRSAAFYSAQCAELATLIDSLGKASELSVLDFGMGWGNWCRLASGFGCRTFGAELCEERLRHAARLGILPPEDEERFNLIHADQVLEHLAEPAKMLQSLSSRLDDHGVVHITVPDCRSLGRRLKRFRWDAPMHTKESLQMAAPLEHINSFNHASLVRVAEESGLQLDRSRTQSVIRSTRRGLRRVRAPLGTNLVFAKAA